MLLLSLLLIDYPFLISCLIANLSKLLFSKLFLNLLNSTYICIVFWALNIMYLMPEDGQ